MGREFLAAVRDLPGGSAAVEGINLPPPPDYLLLGNGLLLVSRQAGSAELWEQKWRDDPSMPPPPPEPEPSPPPEPRVVQIGPGIYLRKPSKDPANERERMTP